MCNYLFVSNEFHQHSVSQIFIFRNERIFDETDFILFYLQIGIFLYNFAHLDEHAYD